MPLLKVVIKLRYGLSWEMSFFFPETSTYTFTKIGIIFWFNLNGMIL